MLTNLRYTGLGEVGSKIIQMSVKLSFKWPLISKARVLTVLKEGSTFLPRVANNLMTCRQIRARKKCTSGPRVILRFKFRGSLLRRIENVVLGLRN